MENIKIKSDIAERYSQAYLNIIRDNNLTFEQKKALIKKLFKSVTRASKNAERRVVLNKVLQKLNLDKIATAELLVASIFPVMGVSLITWGLGSDVDRELYNKIFGVLMNPVLKVSAVGAFAGLGTTIFQESIKNKIGQNIEKAKEKKDVLDEVRSTIETSINEDELSL